MKICRASDPDLLSAQDFLASYKIKKDLNRSEYKIQNDPGLLIMKKGADFSISAPEILLNCVLREFES